MPELLSICIPTYNRAAYLGDLLESLAREHEATPWAGEIAVHISDNASTDDTREVIARYARRLPLSAHRNVDNIGGDRNFARLIGLSAGDYFWLLGDDETVQPGSLARLLELLRPRQYGLLLLPSLHLPADGAGPPVPRPYLRREPEGGKVEPLAAELFPHYAAYVERHRESNPFAMIGHSLISYNVIRRDCFDRELHRRMLETEDIHYAHMYGMVGGLKRTGAGVYVCAFPVVLVRPVRATVAASRLLIRRSWSRYLEWLGREFGHPGLVRHGRSLFSPLDRLNHAFRRRFSRRRPGF